MLLQAPSSAIRLNVASVLHAAAPGITIYTTLLCRAMKDEQYSQQQEALATAVPPSLHCRVMKAEMYSQQQEALAAAAQAKTEREREAHQSVAAAERTSVVVAEERGARLAAERRLEAVEVAHVDQVRVRGHRGGSSTHVDLACRGGK